MARESSSILACSAYRKSQSRGDTAMCIRRMFQHRHIFVLAIIVVLYIGVVLGAGPTAAAEEVVVYTARHYGQEPVFDAFTKQTGIAVKLFDGSPPELFERLQAEGDKTPA